MPDLADQDAVPLSSLKSYTRSGYAGLSKTIKDDNLIVVVYWASAPLKGVSPHILLL